MKLKELLNIWLSKYVRHSIKERTYTNYQNIIDNHIIPVLGNYEITILSTIKIQEYINNKIEKGNLINGNKLSYNTVMSIMSVLKLVLKWAYENKMIDKDITLKVKVPQNEQKDIKVFSNNEQRLLEQYCLNNKNNYIGIVLCLYTGLRIGELLALTWNDIDFDKKTLSVNKTVCRIKVNGISKIHIDTPKSKSSKRIIPIPIQIIPYLKKIKKNSKSIYVISTRTNKMVETRAYQKLYERILKRLKLNYRNFHTLRHTFATRALELGMDIKTISEILGHSNAVITLNRYSHSLLSYKIEMMNKLGKNILKQTL